jgi:hypothetical protein
VIFRAGRWICPNKSFSFVGTFDDDFPIRGIWTESSGESFDVVLREKTVLASFATEQDAIFKSKVRAASTAAQVSTTLQSTSTHTRSIARAAGAALH